MKRLCFLPENIRVMTWQELARYANSEQKLDSAVLMLHSIEQAMFVPQTDWNRVVKLGRFPVSPGTNGKDTVQSTADAVAEFIADLAGAEEYGTVGTLVITVYDGTLDRINDRRKAYAVAAAVADWATGSNAMEYYAAVAGSDTKISKDVYREVSEALSRHEPEFSEPGE